MTTPLAADRAALVDALTATLTGWQITPAEVEQPRPPLATIAPGDPWVRSTDTDLTWLEDLVTWRVRLIVTPGPALAVLDRLIHAVDLIRASTIAHTWTIGDITSPMTLVVSDSLALPSTSLTLTRPIPRS
ncbi:hypothetical protein [Acidipropionibacterium timonense]|uniref:hypothetical protein n=1 Tax=Acidipropionibacterium timonense TaxID=2161818 RepID=UPI00103181BB|nr:hypothetical protein [Acidipropionibacterium timonense]